MNSDGSSKSVRFERAVEAIYDTAVSPEAWPDTLDAIARVFDDFGANLTYFRSDGTSGAVVSSKLVAGASEYNDYWHRFDIRTQRGLERGYFSRTGIITDSDIGSQEELQNHRFYSEFLAKYGLGWFAAITLLPSFDVHVALTIQRLASKSPFTPQECQTLARLGAHLEKALRLGLRVVNAEKSTAGLKQVFETLSLGIIMLDSQPRLVFINDSARRIFGSEVRLRYGKLVGSKSPPIDLKLSKQLFEKDSLSSSVPLQPIGISQTENSPSLLLHLIPVPAVTSLWADRFLSSARLIIVVEELNGSGPVDPALVRDVLGLTSSEARVASLIGSGMSVKETSSRLGITEGSVRTVLKRIYAKTMMSRQNELAALLASLRRSAR